MNMYNIRKKITMENLLSLYVILNPILDIASFLYRNYFKTSFSPSTVLRPIIPIVLFVILFFKENNKMRKVGVISIYAIYSVIHLLIFKMLHNESSYGNIINEIQYITNYSFMIINLYLFYKILKNTEKIEKCVFISTSIYVISLFISIITNTSSSTYIEGIGYKGYFESGNSLCTVLLLATCIIIPDTSKKDWKKIILIIATGVYLVLFSGMRTGVFGFSIIVIVFVLGKFFISIKQNNGLNKKNIVIITIGIVLTIILLIILGSLTLQRRKMLKENELNNLDEETQSLRYVTGDILSLYKKIQNNELSENYMSEPEKSAIIDLYNFSKKIKLSNVNLRAQQLIYNVCLVKEQKNIILILFGNGYKNQTGELVMEMEIPALICNFGIVGFILYFGPFLSIFIIGIYQAIKNRKDLSIYDIMYLAGCGLAIASGYVYFVFSSMTMTIILNRRILWEFYMT